MTETVAPPVVDPTNPAPASSVPEKTPPVVEKVDPSKLTPAQIQELLEYNKTAKDHIHTLNQENEKHRKANQKIIEDQKKADDEKLKSQGEFQKLHEKVSGELNATKETLTKQQQELETASKMINSSVDSRIKNWPDEVKNLVPAIDSTSAVERLAQVEKLEPLAQKLLGTPSKPGNTPGPQLANRGVIHQGNVRQVTQDQNGNQVVKKKLGLF